MAVNFGEAIAMGVTQGLGQGAQQYYNDMRREKMDAKKISDTFNMFKKQTVYANRVKNVQAMNATAEQWKTQAGKSTNTLAYELAMKSAEGLSKADKPKFFRDTMKQLNGMSKTELLTRGGYTQPDYSQFMDDPTLQDAIPKSYMAYGSEPDESMSEVFKYDPRAYEEVAAKQAEKINMYTQKRDDDIAVINSVSTLNYGSSLSSEAAKTLWKMSGGADPEMQGATLSSNSTGLMAKWLQKGILVDTGSELVLRSELSDEELDTFAPDEAPTEDTTEQPMIGADVYEDPTKAAQLTEEKQLAEKKRIDTKVEGLSKGLGKSIQSMNSLEDLGMSLSGLSEDAKEILFGAATLKGALSLTDVGKKIAAKADVPGAKEAREFLSKMTNVSASLKHEQYGSAQTATELKTFADQLGDPSLLQNPETLLAQIESRMNLIGSDVEAGMSAYDEDIRNAYLERNPQFKTSVKMALGGEDKGTKQTVSDLPKAYDAQGNAIELPPEFAKASPEKQQQFLTHYNLKLKGTK